MYTEDFELSKSEKAEVYETAMRYFAVKAYRTGEDLDQKKYDLATIRAGLGPVEEQKHTEKKYLSNH